MSNGTSVPPTKMFQKRRFSHLQRFWYFFLQTLASDEGNMKKGNREKTLLGKKKKLKKEIFINKTKIKRSSRNHAFVASPNFFF